jgi:hypothetical protein|eukprot:COSAG02_NODE_632_length_19286_cov_1518.762235_20_plen_84_part_00
MRLWYFESDHGRVRDHHNERWYSIEMDFQEAMVAADQFFVRSEAAQVIADFDVLWTLALICTQTMYLASWSAKERMLVRLSKG